MTTICCVLDTETVEIADHCTKQLGQQNRSAFLRWLIRNYYDSLDLASEIESVELRKKEIELELKRINEKASELKARAEVKVVHDEERESKIKEVVELLYKRMLEKIPIMDLRETARYWGFKLQMDGETLLAMANEKFSVVTKS